MNDRKRKHQPKIKTKLRCPMCRVGGYIQKMTIIGETGDGRPEFICTNCKCFWTNGRDGGEYRLW